MIRSHSMTHNDKVTVQILTGLAWRYIKHVTGLELISSFANSFQNLLPKDHIQVAIPPGQCSRSHHSDSSHRHITTKSLSVTRDVLNYWKPGFTPIRLRAQNLVQKKGRTGYPDLAILLQQLLELLRSWTVIG